MTFLLDTSIISELASTNPNPEIMHWLDAQREETVFISVLTLANISECIEKEPSSAKKALISNWFKNDFLVRFSGRINEITIDVSLKWGEIITKLRQQGRNLSLADSMSLTIAIVNGHTLVTRDISIFENTGVKAFSPIQNKQ
ncbi:MAG: PIN domain-containing protein [Anaerolineaceae bacterium]